MKLVLDTNVFFSMCAGENESNLVYAKIIRDCDLVYVENRIWQEYLSVLVREGFKFTLVQLKLQDFDIRGKLRNITRKVPQLQNIVTHEKDRHLIEIAHATDAIIITYEKEHLLDLKDNIKKELGIKIVNPHEYLELPHD